MITPLKQNNNQTSKKYFRSNRLTLIGSEHCKVGYTYNVIGFLIVVVRMVTLYCSSFEILNIFEKKTKKKKMIRQRESIDNKFSNNILSK